MFHFVGQFCWNRKLESSKVCIVSATRAFGSAFIIVLLYSEAHQSNVITFQFPQQEKYSRYFHPHLNYRNFSKLLQHVINCNFNADLN